MNELTPIKSGSSKQRVITSVVLLLVIVIFILGYAYFSEETDKKRVVSRPWGPVIPAAAAPSESTIQTTIIQPAEPLKTPGILKAEDGWITTNAYTKQEKFHPFMDQSQADQIATSLLASETVPPVEKVADTGEEKVQPKEGPRDMKNRLLNSFYRYKDGKAEKMGQKEVDQILFFEATFTGYYE